MHWKPKIKENIQIKNTEEGDVLIDILSGKLFKLNNAGSDILQLCDGKTEVDVIVSQLQKEYDGVRKEEVISYLENLKRIGLVI